jgi:polyhydroxybutyrate depolymerase
MKLDMSATRPLHGALLLSIGTIWGGCSSDATEEPGSGPGQPGGATMSPATNGQAPGAGTSATPGAPSGTTGNGSTDAPASNEANDPGSVDTSMLGDTPATAEPPGTGAGEPAGPSDNSGEMTGEGETPEPTPDDNQPTPPEQPAAGCPATALAPGDSTRTVNVGNATRTYILHVPDTYTGEARVPLLFDFHGLGGNGQQERNGSSFVAATQSEGVILAFPTGTSDGSGNGWNVGTCCASGDDVGFTRAMVAQIRELACIDDKRIYATGFSNGGGMSYKLACDAADIFAAVAPASFDLAEDNVDDCSPSRPISIVAQRGTADFAVPFDGGPTPVTNRIVFLGAQATFDKWSELDGCSGAEQDIGNNCKKVSQCQAGTEVNLCVIQGGGHQPGSASLLWPLLRQYTMP